MDSKQKKKGPQKPMYQASKKPVTQPKGRPAVSGVAKAYPSKAAVVTPVVVVDWNVLHAEFTNRIADLTKKVTAKAVAYEVENLKVYTEWKEKMEKSLATQTSDVDTLIAAETAESSKKVVQSFAKSELDEYDQEIQEFWREVSRADHIRTRLRKGAALYRADNTAKIPELYAGSFEDAKEVVAKVSVFAKLINNSKWFTDTSGAPFAKHEHSRSAGLGFSPAGEQHIPLHIGHKQDTTKK